MPDTKRKLVDAGVKLMRVRGYNATGVNDICEEAGVTKGGFFHYFKSKDDVAREVAVRFREIKAQSFQEAPFRKLADPLDRVFGRLDFAKESIGDGTHLTKGCLIGVFAQELSLTHSELREVCQEFFSQMAENFEADLAEAKAVYAPNAEFEPKKLALLYVAMMQGSLMLAKASQSNQIVWDNIEQFRQYLKMLFGKSN
jgi:TetR/AcrR family transcriptional repressor of nem operon